MLLYRKSSALKSITHAFEAGKMHSVQTLLAVMDSLSFVAKLLQLGESVFGLELFENISIDFLGS